MSTLSSQCALALVSEFSVVLNIWSIYLFCNSRADLGKNFLDSLERFQNLLQRCSWSCAAAAPWRRPLCTLLGRVHCEPNNYYRKTDKLLHANLMWDIYRAGCLFKHVFCPVFHFNGFSVCVFCRPSYAAGSTAGWWLWTSELMVSIDNHKT